MSQKKALVIAVASYQNKDLHDLDFCEKDGKEVHKTLKSLGFEMHGENQLIGNVSAQNIRDTVTDFFINNDIKTNDTLLFYYSGHGVPDSDGNVYLASTEIDPDVPIKRGLSFEDLTTIVGRSSSKKSIVVLDSCFSGRARISKGGEDSIAKSANSQIKKQSEKILECSGKGRCLLSASSGYQEAYGSKEKGHSIFTFYFLEGLKGAEGKSVDKFGNVTPESISNYVYDSLMNLPTEKRPKQEPIRKMEGIGDIIIASYPNFVTTDTTGMNNIDLRTELEKHKMELDKKWEEKFQKFLDRSKEKSPKKQSEKIREIKESRHDKEDQTWEKSMLKSDLFSHIENGNSLKNNIFTPDGNWSFVSNTSTGSMGQVEFYSDGTVSIDLFEQALNQRMFITGYWVFDSQTQVLSINGVLNGALPWNYAMIVQNFSHNYFSCITPEGFQINFTKK
ncbi:hypothetical protein YTPLAS73_09890 [Nitrosarchaeum sp.]|nr:hypothetical protein YTPLAS73_09890 [Nitrosarchaeum sp.]